MVGYHRTPELGNPSGCHLNRSGVTVVSIAETIRCVPQTLREWAKKAEGQEWDADKWSPSEGKSRLRLAPAVTRSESAASPASRQVRRSAVWLRLN